jgi:hypothetical protein
MTIFIECHHKNGLALIFDLIYVQNKQRYNIMYRQRHNWILGALRSLHNATQKINSIFISWKEVSKTVSQSFSPPGSISWLLYKQKPKRCGPKWGTMCCVCQPGVAKSGWVFLNFYITNIIFFDKLQFKSINISSSWFSGVIQPTHTGIWSISLYYNLNSPFQWIRHPYF